MTRTLELDVEARLGTLHLRATLDTAATRVAITGPSGAGKSTLLRILAGLEPRARGRVAFAGTTWHEGARIATPPWQRRVGWVPQDSLLFPHLDVRKNLSYAGAPPGPVAEIADLLELTPLLDRAPRHLSGGERQRAALGRALLSSPRLLLLDEPFAALDDALRARLTQRVGAHCRSAGLAFVLVTHDATDAAALAEETWTIQQGLLARAP